VRSIYVNWERGDWSSVEWAHPEIEFVIPDGAARGSWTGLAGMAEGWRGWLSAWKDYGVAVDEFRELDEERVLVLVHQHGRGKTSGLEIGQMSAKGASLFHIRNGKVTKQPHESGEALLGPTASLSFPSRRSRVRRGCYPSSPVPRQSSQRLDGRGPSSAFLGLHGFHGFAGSRRQIWLSFRDERRRRPKVSGLGCHPGYGLCSTRDEILATSWLHPGRVWTAASDLRRRLHANPECSRWRLRAAGRCHCGRERNCRARSPSRCHSRRSRFSRCRCRPRRGLPQGWLRDRPGRSP
jgi:hypothetical protein